MNRLLLIVGLLFMPIPPASEVGGASTSLTVPATVEGQPATFVTVQATTDGDAVEWLPLDPGLAVVPSSLLLDSRQAVVLAAEPGTYRLLAFTPRGETPTRLAVCYVVIGKAAPTPTPEPLPPVPKPEPPPLPPIPKPVPPVAAPADLVTAWAKETGTKTVDRDALVKVFEDSASMVKGTKLTTVAELMQAVAVMRQKVIGERLPNLRGAVSVRINAVLSADDVLDEETRATVEGLFLELAGMMRGL